MSRCITMIQWKLYENKISMCTYLFFNYGDCLEFIYRSSEVLYIMNVGLTIYERYVRFNDNSFMTL